MIRVAIAIATVGYVGYAPLVPGTFGSAAGLALYGLIRVTGSVTLEALSIALVAVLGVWASTTAERYFGTIDPGPVVIDEVLGMLITLMFLRVGAVGVLVGFVLFRVFDIFKPFPAARFERLPGGLGVMADDAVAALYAHIVLRGALWIAPAWIA